MKRNWKTMVMGLVLGGVSLWAAAAAVAGHPGGSGGSHNSGHSQMHTMSNRGNTGFTGNLNSGMGNKMNSLPLHNLQNHGTTQMKHTTPFQINNHNSNQNTGINGGHITNKPINNHNTGINIHNISNPNNGNHNTGINGHNLGINNHNIKNHNTGINGHNLGINNHNIGLNNHNHNNHGIPFSKIGLGNACNHHHHHTTHYCGKNPCWQFPVTWWYPNTNFCRTICGTYCQPIYPVNVVTIVEPIAVPVQGLDLVLQSVGAVDSGNMQAGLGPNFRVTVRNNSMMPVSSFNVLVMAGMDQTARQDLPATVVKLDGMQSGQFTTFEVRLPVTALMMSRDISGMPISHTTVFVAVDSGEDLPDIDRSNNGAVLALNQIPVVQQ